MIVNDVENITCVNFTIVYKNMKEKFFNFEYTSFDVSYIN